MRRLRATIREETGRDLPVAVTEFNSHWSQAVSGEATPDSFFSAIWLGDVLGRLIRQKVDIANQFLLVSGNESGFGILEKYGPRPAYYTYQMYKMFGDQLVCCFLRTLRTFPSTPPGATTAPSPSWPSTSATNPSPRRCS